MLLRIDHVGFACRDLASKIAFYESVFGLTLVSQETNPEQGVREAMLRVSPGSGGPAGTGQARTSAAGPSYVQLLEPLGPDTPVGRFLDRRGEGIHHVGYGVADIEAALAAMKAAGVRLIDSRSRHGSMGAAIAFLHPADLGGVLTELVEQAIGDNS